MFKEPRGRCWHSESPEDVTSPPPPLARVAVTHQRDVISDCQDVWFALTSAGCMNHMSAKAVESFCKQANESDACCLMMRLGRPNELEMEMRRR